MSADDLKELFEAWNSMDMAARNLQTALPFQMTERASQLEAERARMNSTVLQLMKKTAGL